MHSYVFEWNEVYASNLNLLMYSDVKYVHILLSIDTNFRLVLKFEFEISSSAKPIPLLFRSLI